MKTARSLGGPTFSLQITHNTKKMFSDLSLKHCVDFLYKQTNKRCFELPDTLKTIDPLLLCENVLSSKTARQGLS